MKGDNARQLSAELTQILRRFAKRNELELRGHVRVGNTVLWANYGGMDQVDPLLLGEFVKAVQKGHDNDGDAGRSAQPETGDGNSLR